MNFIGAFLIVISLAYAVNYALNYHQLYQKDFFSLKIVPILIGIPVVLSTQSLSFVALYFELFGGILSGIYIFLLFVSVCSFLKKKICDTGAQRIFDRSRELMVMKMSIAFAALSLPDIVLRLCGIDLGVHLCQIFIAWIFFFMVRKMYFFSEFGNCSYPSQKEGF